MILLIDKLTTVLNPTKGNDNSFDHIPTIGCC